MGSPQSRPFLRVGLTGGIGAGKSTVGRFFAGRGRLVISADDIARTIADENSEVRSAITAEFGSAAYLQNGSLDRKHIASIVFSDDKKRRKLNSIIHPAVFSFIDRQLDTLPPERRAPYVVIEAALIYETGMNDSLDYVVVVEASEDLCVKRVVLRDNTGEDEVRRRMDAQMPVETKVKLADFVIHNDKSEVELQPPVMLVDMILSQLSKTR